MVVAADEVHLDLALARIEEYALVDFELLCVRNAAAMRSATHLESTRPVQLLQKAGDPRLLAGSGGAVKEQMRKVLARRLNSKYDKIGRRLDVQGPRAAW